MPHTDIVTCLHHLYDTRADAIEAWLSKQRKGAEPFFYNSVDLRHSSHRLVPVDTNLFPAGFNNLSPAAIRRAVIAVHRLMEEAYPNAKRILIVPENHTRNLAYLENLHMLSQIITQAGFEVKTGTLREEASAPEEMEALSGDRITQYPLKREGNKVFTAEGFVPDVVLLNNDCTSGEIPLLAGLSQPVIPPMRLGWWQRRKSEHFRAYKALVEDFSAQFHIDPWRLNAGYESVSGVDFKHQLRLDAVARAIDCIVAKAKQKHVEYGITDAPYVYVKADSGTYGMGIMTVHDGAEMLELNKKARNKMQVVKEGAQVSEVIIQEGIPTIDTVQNDPAEPLICLIDGIPVGGMYRVNAERDAFGNLNAAGMRFTGMCDESEPPDCHQPIKDCDFRAYGLIAAIAALAVPREEYGENEAPLAMKA